MKFTLAAIIISIALSTAAVDKTAEILADIVDNYYIYHQVPLLLSGMSKSTREDVIHQVVRNLQILRVIQLDSAISGYKPWFYVVFFFEDVDEFLDFLDQLRSPKFDLFGYYTFVFDQISYAELNSTFDALWKLKIIRAVVLAVNDGNPQLYNYSPFSHNKCGIPTVHRIQNFKSTTLFISHLTQFYDCPLQLGTFETPPFVHFLSPSEINGFEGDLVTTLSLKLRFNLTIVTPPDDAQWGIPQRKGSTGLMKLIQEETVQFGIGCLGLIAQRNEIIQPGDSHYTSRILFAVPSGRPFSAFEKLFRPFEHFVWCVIVGLLVGSALLWLIMKFVPITVREFVYGARNQSPFLNLLSVYYTGVTHNVPVRNFARTLLFLWICCCFVIRTVYQGLLFKHLQLDSHHKTLEANEEIDISNLHYYMLQMSERFFENNPRVLSRVRRISAGNDSLNRMLNALARKQLQDGVVLVSSENIAFHNKHRLDQGFVSGTRDQVAWSPIVIYYPKRSFLVRVFNRVIGRIQTAGLMNHWGRKYGNYDFFPKRINMGQPKVLNVEQLMGCFELSGFLWMLSCFIFLMELLSQRMALLRRVLDFITYQ